MADGLALRLTVLLPEIPLLQGEAARALLAQEAGQAMQGIVERVASEARDHAPVGVSGLARASIGTRVTLGEDAGSLVSGEVVTGAQAPYWLYLEEGSAPHWPPRAPIELWAARVLGDATLWFLVARAISRRGTPARHVMRDALATVEPTMQPTLQAAVDRAAQRIMGN